MNLQEANKVIKQAWGAGVVSGTLTLLLTIAAMFGMQFMGLTIWSLIDVLLIYGFSFGIYRKSRTCAILLFIYFVYCKIVMIIEGPGRNGIFLALLFGYCFFRGIVGTFAYHKANKVAPVEGVNSENIDNVRI